MKTKLLFLGLSCAGILSVQAQVTTSCEPLKVTNGFNADVFVEDVPVADHLTAGIDNNTTGFYTTAVSLGGITTGLPLDMPLKSAEGVIYNIDYTKANALELTSVNEGELTLASPVSTDKLYFLGLKADGGPTTANVEVVVTYDDGTTQTGTITYRDWVGTGGTAFNGLKLFDVNGKSLNTSYQIRLDEPSVACDATKKVTKIKFTNKTLSGTHPLVLGVSTGKTPVEVASGFNKDAVAEGNSNPTYATGIGNTSLVLYAEPSSNTLGGLPLAQPMKSLQGHTYNIDYKTNNVLMLKSANEGTLTLAAPVKTSQLYCLGFKADGSSATSQVEALVTYADGSTQKSTITYNDWVRSGGTAFDGLRLVDTSNGYITTRNSSYNISMDEPAITCDPNKEIVSVKFTNTTLNGTHPVIFGLSTGTEAVAISDGLNEDVIAEPGRTGMSYTSTIGGTSFVLFANGTGGLPADGNIETPSGAKYAIDYAGLNTLRLGVDNVTTTGTLTLDGSQKAEKIYVLGTSTGGQKFVRYTIKYADGTTTSGSFKINDWVYTKPVMDDNMTAYYGLDRFANGSPETNFRLALYENEIDPNPTKVITSITFGCTASMTLIMGLSMQRASADAVYGVKMPIDETGCSTLYYGTKNLIVPEGATANTYKIVNNVLAKSKVYVAGSTIPAGEAVVISGVPSTYTFGYNDAPAETDVKDPDNMLCGFDKDTETAGPSADVTYKYYLVSLNGANDAGSAGFYYCAADGAAFLSQAHRAYLAAPADVAKDKSYLFTEVTGIKDITSTAHQSDAIYTISGVRVQKSQMHRGIYIVNGKKVVVK